MTVSLETKKPVPRPSVVSTSTTAGIALLTTSSTDRAETVPRAAVSTGGAADGLADGAACVNNAGSLGHCGSPGLGSADAVASVGCGVSPGAGERASAGGAGVGRRNT